MVGAAELVFEAEECRLALQRCGGDVEAALRLLLTLLAPSSDAARAALLTSGDGFGKREDAAAAAIDAYVAHAIAAMAGEDAPTDGDNDAAQLVEEMVVLESIFGDGFALDRGSDQVVRRARLGD